MIAGLLPTAHLPVHVRRDQTINDGRAEEQVVDTKARVAGPCVSEVVPESVDALTWMRRPHRISPALREQTMESLTDLGPEQGIVNPALRLIDVEFGGHHIEIAGEHDGHTGRKELRSVRGQSIEPAQLVIELRAGGRISVRQIQATNQHPIDRRLDVAAVRVIRIAGQAATRFRRRPAARKYGNAVPALLAVPDRAVAGFPNCRLGEFVVRGLQLLQAGDVRLDLGEPAHQHRETAINTVHVERRDLHL